MDNAVGASLLPRTAAMRLRTAAVTAAAIRPHEDGAAAASHSSKASPAAASSDDPSLGALNPPPTAAPAPAGGGGGGARQSNGRKRLSFSRIRTTATPSSSVSVSAGVGGQEAAGTAATAACALSPPSPSPSPAARSLALPLWRKLLPMQAQPTSTTSGGRSGHAAESIEERKKRLVPSARLDDLKTHEEVDFYESITRSVPRNMGDAVRVFATRPGIMASLAGLAVVVLWRITAFPFSLADAAGA